MSIQGLDLRKAGEPMLLQTQPNNARLAVWLWIHC